MARRINGEGSVFRDTDRGGWVGLLYVDGKRRKVRAKTKTDVSARLAELRKAAADGVVANGNVTVGAVLDVWRERTLANRTLEPKSRDNHDLALRVLAAEFGKVRLRTLDVARVERGLDHISMGAYGRGKPLSRRSLKLYRATLVQVLDLAVRRKLVAANSAVHAEVTPTATPAVPRRALSESEAEALWDAVDGERLGPCWQLMLLTGLRPGEALGLCWDAVDIDGALLHVWRAVRVERGKARLVDTLKTAPSYRTISLPEPAVQLLRRQRGAVATLRLAARMWITDDPGLVFPTINGAPWNPKNARCTPLGSPASVPTTARRRCIRRRRRWRSACSLPASSGCLLTLSRRCCRASVPTSRCSPRSGCNIVAARCVCPGRADPARRRA